MPNKRLLSTTRLAVLCIAGLWAAGLGTVGAAPEPRTATPQLKRLSADAGRRITTVTIETTDPVAYLTNRPDPMTLFVDLRDVDMGRVAREALGAKGLVAGVTVEQAAGADGSRVARVRIRLTEAAAHQVRSKRNLIHIDFDGEFPVGSVGNASAAAAPRTSARFATVLEDVRAEAKPSGATITLTGNGELVASSITPLSDGTPRVAIEFPNVKSTAPPDLFVGRGPVSVVRVSTTGTTPTTRVVVNLMRPATYRVVPPEDGGRHFTITFEEEVQAVSDKSAPPPSTAVVAALDPIDALLKRGGLGLAGAMPSRAGGRRP